MAGPRYESPDMRTLRVGLIGEHISRTRFPAALELMCQNAGLRLDFSLIDTSELERAPADFDFARTVNVLRAEGWDGVSVTHPYKQDAADYASAASPPDVRALGAANTLIFGPPTGVPVIGANTDYTGFLSAWQAHMRDVPVGCVALAGAGGVARALGPALAKLGAREIRVWDVSKLRAQELAAMIGGRARVVPADQWPKAIASADGLVNATPMGMAHLPGSAFASELINTQKWAFDAVYTPTDTDFLTDCAGAGLTCLSGFDLFRHMAMRSFQAYTGIESDPTTTLSMLAKLRPG